MTFHSVFFEQKLNHEQQLCDWEEQLLALLKLKQEIEDNQEKLKNTYLLLASQADDKCILIPEDKKITLERIEESIQKKTEMLNTLNEKIKVVNNHLSQRQVYFAEESHHSVTVP